MDSFSVEIEDGREINYEVSGGIWQKKICPHFNECMNQKSECKGFNINRNCGCCDDDIQLSKKQMAGQFKFVLETLCGTNFEKLLKDDFRVVKEIEELYPEIKMYSQCICTHNIYNQYHIEYKPKKIVIRIGSECLKKNMPTEIRDSIFESLKDSRKKYKNEMKQLYKQNIEQFSKYVFDFGKYKGQKLNQIPKNYLDWIENVDNPNDKLLKIRELIQTKRMTGFNDWFSYKKSSK